MNPTLDPRLAGEVSRYHTWPRIRDQSVGEHSWQVLRILYAIAPERLTSEFVEYVVFHDVGEIGVGDPPFPVKRNNPDLKAIMDRLENDHLEDMGIKLPLITEDQKKVFKYAELIEMYEWGVEELLRGNRMARLVADRCDAAATEAEQQWGLPSSVITKGQQYRAWRRWQSNDQY